MKKFAYILLGSFNESIMRQNLTNNISVCTVKNFDEAKEMIVSLRQEGFGAIELCGAFGRDRALELIELTSNEVVVGYVVNEPAQNELIAKFFGGN